MGALSDFEDRLETVSRRHPGMPTHSVRLVKFIAFAQQRADAMLADVFAAHGLSHSAWSLLMMIYSSPSLSISPSAASDALNQSRAHMTRLTDELVADGWVERLAQTGDRRAIDVRLTRAGTSRLQSLLPKVGAAYERLLACFDQDERARIEALMRRWIVHLEAGSPLTPIHIPSKRS